MGLFSIIVLGCHGRPFWSDSFQFWEFLYIVPLIVFAAFLLLLLNFYFIFLFCFQSLFSGRLLKLCLLNHSLYWFFYFADFFFIAKGFFFLLWIFSLKKKFFFCCNIMSLRMFITVFWSLCLFPQSSCFCLFWSLSFWWLFSNI